MVAIMRPALVLIFLLAAATSARGQGLGTRLDSAMRAAERDGFSGVVRIEKDGVTQLERGYGLANRAARVPFTPATVVQIGSNTKDFTAVAVLQLQQRGLLSVKDSIGKYFPGAPPDKRNITILQLMTHQAGFPLGIGGDFDPLGRQAMIDSAMHYRLLFSPGARESYSNTGYGLLAAIVEQLSGLTYDEYVRDFILAPLGLRRTGFLLPNFQSADLAHGYLGAGADQGTMLAKPHAPDGPYWNLRGNGGMLSTVADMHAFYKALFETDKLLPLAHRKLRFDPDEPILLAGSDMVNFFLYDRDPIAHTEIIIASTNAAYRAPMIRRSLGKILGLPDPDGGGPANGVAPRQGGKAAPAAIAAVITDLVKAINSGDTTALRRFILDHMSNGAGDPPVDARLQRIGGIHERLGVLTIDRIESFDTGPVEVTLTSALQGGALLRVNIDAAAPYLIRSLQMEVGG